MSETFHDPNDGHGPAVTEFSGAAADGPDRRRVQIDDRHGRHVQLTVPEAIAAARAILDRFTEATGCQYHDCGAPPLRGKDFCGDHNLPGSVERVRRAARGD